MLHRVRTEFLIAALCLIGLLGACSPAVAEVHCPQAAPCMGPCAYCPGHYPCIPNAANYGYFPTIWRPWPTERRPDQAFPQSIGREVLPTPPGEQPEPLPRQKVEDIQPVQPGPSTQEPIIEGVDEPGIHSPLPAVPGGALPGGLPLESALPSLDAIPQAQPVPRDNAAPGSPAPETSSPAPLLPDTTPADSLPAPTADPLQTPGAGDGTGIGRGGYRELLLSGTSHFPALPTTSAHPEFEIAGVPQTLQEPLTESKPVEEETPVAAEESPELPEPKPLALDGYCPVELIEKQAWTLGEERWCVEHNGVIYRFAKEAHLNRFMEEPGRYVPVQGGKDPVLLKRDQRSVSGQTDFCAIYKNRLYMFSSRESLTAFRQNPKQYGETIIRR